MIDSILIDQLLDKLIAEVHNTENQWLSLPKYFETNKNEPLRHYIIENNKYAYTNKVFSNKSPLISEYRSHCISMDGGVVILFTFKEARGMQYSLAIQPTSSSGVTVISCNDRQNEKLSELAKVINDEQYEAARYIKRIVENI